VTTPGPAQLQRTSRDVAQLRTRLQGWLATRLPAGADPVVGELAATSANGMSSETLLFAASWTADGRRSEHELVARLAPDAGDVPVFPSYDMARQFEVLRVVAGRTPVPVPGVRWLETDPAPLGAAFFVMDRVEGLVPPDVMPYTFGGNWLADATDEQRGRLTTSTLQVLADLHALPADDPQLAFLASDDAGETPLRRHVAHTRAWYDWVAADGVGSPLIERGFAWLEQHWPAQEPPAVLLWGDARIGNVMYDDFTPAAVLDWEMAGVGPRDLDVAWLLYAHRVFQDIAAGLAGLPGLPDFLQPDAVAARYEALTGHALPLLDFALVYSCLQYGIVFLRTGQRSVRFGEREMPADVDDLLINRATLESLVAPAGPAAAGTGS